MARARKHNPTIPRHIEQSKIPTGVYWDASGKGRWYVFTPHGESKRKTIAQRDATLADLYMLIEKGTKRNTLRWLCESYFESPKFSGLANASKRDYKYGADTAIAYPTKTGVAFGDLDMGRIRTHHLQRMVDAIAAQGTPTKANKVLRFLRMVFRWGKNRGFCQHNPATGLEEAKERKRRRLPSEDVYQRIITFCKEGALKKPKTMGSVPPYLWIVLDISYMMRLRAIETITLTDAHVSSTGISTTRRKRSKDNMTLWSNRLRAAHDAAVEYRAVVRERLKKPTPLKPEQRFLIVDQSGQPLGRSALDSAFQRMIRNAVRQGVILEEDRFGLHDTKRKGGTDAPGHRGDRQDALGVTDQMMGVYDHSRPEVRPSGGD